MDPGTDWLVEDGNYCLDFDPSGSRDYVDCWNTTQMDVDYITIAMRVASDITDTFLAFASRADATDKNFIVGHGVTASRYGFFFYVGGATKSLTGSNDFTTGQFDNVVFTYDGSNMSIYVNGVLDNTKAQTGIIDKDSVGMIIGGRTDTSFAYNGRIAYCYMWNHGKTAYEVRLIHANPYAMFEYRPLVVNAPAVVVSTPTGTLAMMGCGK